jgi:hypothetical protein
VRQASQALLLVAAPVAGSGAESAPQQHPQQQTKALEAVLWPTRQQRQQQEQGRVQASTVTAAAA